ncbi:Ig-like domain-containing protein [Pseudoalteromonas denitrificans]|uniref:Ig-like domain (Group 2) n=1 Tax=Pseudoalteromonas denitrificans DSM 6059 TaxID=1123010 RepID=A0A1I1RR03_9GAMM|nr:Ig-like domain-containing protein [Pseudoalteromonas denitrificans]SFD32980.1 Ig-like domain (group 2) [Pseudoalteromonas denitrificans DSM 6059]
MRFSKLVILLSISSSVLLAGCDSDNDSEALAKAVALESQRAKGTIIESVTISGGQTRLKAGEIQQLTALGIDTNNDQRDVTSELQWTSSDTSIATVSNKGLVTAVASSTENSGIVIIKGTTINDISAQAEVSVSDVGISSLVLKQDSSLSTDILTCIDTQILADVTYEDNYKSLNVTNGIVFSVDNTTTATIDETAGILHTTHSEIEATTITGKIGTISNQLTVNADPKNLETISVLLDNKATSIISLNVGDRVKVKSQAKLVSTISKTLFDIDTNINWELRTANLAGITASGVNKGSLVALKPGVSQLYASCGGVNGIATVEIKGETFESLTINDGAETITLKANESIELTVTAGFKNTTAPVNISEFADWHFSDTTLLTQELVSMGTSAAKYKLTSKSAVGELVLTVSYDGITKFVKIIIE